jgi:hypothetical protein
MKDRLDTFEGKLVKLTKEFTDMRRGWGGDKPCSAFSRSNQEAADEVAAGVAEELRRANVATPTAIARARREENESLMSLSSRRAVAAEARAEKAEAEAAEAMRRINDQDDESVVASAQKDEIIRSQNRTMATDAVRLAHAYRVNDNQARDIAMLKKSLNATEQSLNATEKGLVRVSDSLIRAEAQLVAVGEINTAQARDVAMLKQSLTTQKAGMEAQFERLKQVTRQYEKASSRGYEAEKVLRMLKSAADKMESGATCELIASSVDNSGEAVQAAGFYVNGILQQYKLS